jgi:hypothetical protein
VSGASELDELHSLISSVRRCIAAMQPQYGDIAPMRCIVNDADRLLNNIDRLDIDTDELDSARAAPQPHAGEKIPMPDTQTTPTPGAAPTTKASAGSSAQNEGDLDTSSEKSSSLYP